MGEAKDSWGWTKSEREGAVLVEEPMRPGQMLDEFGYDPAHLCGMCRHFAYGSRSAGHRCLLSLRGSPPRIGYAWRPEWKSCGKWLRREVADDPATARAGDQLRLL